MPPADKKPPDAVPKGMTARPELIGRVLSDRYRVDELIAAGAFGAVYRGAHLHMHKQVAIKVLHPEIENFPELVERFEREAVAGAHISHPNVAVASDLGKFDGDSYFLVQEYVPGETLRELMDRGPIPATRAAFIARQIAEALAAAHVHGIVHRDLKPTNVMLVENTDDLVKLIDFGFARVPIEALPQVPDDDALPDWETSKAGVVFGSMAYLAPDAFLGMKNVDERSDLYALGLIFYEMLASKHPFDVTLPAVQLFEQQRKTPPPPLRERNPDCNAPQDLEWVIMRLLAKAPEERWQDANAAAAAIAGATRGIQGFFTTQESYRPPAAPALRNSASVLEPSDDAKPVARAPRAAEKSLFATALAWMQARPAIAIVGGLVTLGVGITVVTLSVSNGKAPDTAPSTSAANLASAPPATPTPTPAASGREAKADAAVQDLEQSVKAKFLTRADKADAAKAWLLMMEGDSEALKDADVQKKTISMLSRSDPEDEAINKVVDQLAHRTGTLGLDILYGVLEHDPSTKAAERAKIILYRLESVERASPALRVTLDIRRMNCTRKLERFGIAAKVGDERTARQLEKLRPPGCTVKKGACCFKDDAKLSRTLAQIRDR